MKITFSEFEAFFKGGLTQTRREELFVAILCNPQCGRVASAFLLRDELDSPSVFEKYTDDEEDVTHVGMQKIWPYIVATGAFISHSAPCGMYPGGVDLKGRINAFRRRLAKSRAGAREKDALLVKRVVDTCYVCGEMIIHDSTIDEVLQLVEPVVQFWSKQFDKGMFLPGMARSCAHKLLYNPTKSLYKNYKPSEGAFVTYFDTALCNELKKEIEKEIKKSFSHNREENYETSPKDYDLKVDGEFYVDSQMLCVDGKVMVEKIKKVLLPEEWNIFSGRYMYCKKLKEIAEECECSVSRVSRISDATMVKVRKLVFGKECLN